MFLTRYFKAFIACVFVPLGPCASADASPLSPPIARVTTVSVFNQSALSPYSEFQRRAYHKGRSRELHALLQKRYAWPGTAYFTTRRYSKRFQNYRRAMIPTLRALDDVFQLFASHPDIFSNVESMQAIARRHHAPEEIVKFFDMIVRDFLEELDDVLSPAGFRLLAITRLDRWFCGVLPGWKTYPAERWMAFEALALAAVPIDSPHHVSLTIARAMLSGLMTGRVSPRQAAQRMVDLPDGLLPAIDRTNPQISTFDPLLLMVQWLSTLSESSNKTERAVARSILSAYGSHVLRVHREALRAYAALVQTHVSAAQKRLKADRDDRAVLVMPLWRGAEGLGVYLAPRLTSAGVETRPLFLTTTMMEDLMHDHGALPGEDSLTRFESHLRRSGIDPARIGHVVFVDTGMLGSLSPAFVDWLHQHDADADYILLFNGSNLPHVVGLNQQDGWTARSRELLNLAHILDEGVAHSLEPARHLNWKGESPRVPGLHPWFSGWVNGQLAKLADRAPGRPYSRAKPVARKGGRLYTPDSLAEERQRSAAGPTVAVDLDGVLARFDPATGRHDLNLELVRELDELRRHQVKLVLWSAAPRSQIDLFFTQYDWLEPYFERTIAREDYAVRLPPSASDLGDLPELRVAYPNLSDDEILHIYSIPALVYEGLSSVKDVRLPGYDLLVDDHAHPFETLQVSPLAARGLAAQILSRLTDKHAPSVRRHPADRFSKIST